LKVVYYVYHGLLFSAVQVYGLPFDGTRKLQRRLQPVKQWLHQHVAEPASHALAPAKMFVANLQRGCSCGRHSSGNAERPSRQQQPKHELGAKHIRGSDADVNDQQSDVQLAPLQHDEEGGCAK
jgi:hypothetical protein